MGAAVAGGIVSATVILSGINSAATPADVTPEGLLLMKLAMLVLPIILIFVGYLVYLFKFKIDKPFYDKILADLHARGDIREEVQPSMEPNEFLGKQK